MTTIIVPDEKWVACEAEHRVHAHYQDFGIQSGGFFCPDDAAHYIVASRQEDWFLRGHEQGHDPKNGHSKDFDHPTDPVGLFLQGIAVRCDLRSGTEIMRWRVGQWQFLIDAAKADTVAPYPYAPLGGMAA